MNRLQSIIDRHAGVAPDGVDTICKGGVLTGAQVDRKSRIIKGIVTLPSTDMDGDVILPEGIDTETYFMGPDGQELGVKTVYWDHDYSRPVGKCANIANRPGGLFANTFITRLPIGEDILTLVEEGILRGLSIGCRVLDAGPPTQVERDQYGPKCSRVIRKSMMLEYSVTPMPANPGALIEAKSMAKASRISMAAFAMIGGNVAELGTPTRKKIVVLSS